MNAYLSVCFIDWLFENSVRSNAIVKGQVTRAVTFDNLCFLKQISWVIFPYRFFLLLFFSFNILMERNIVSCDRLLPSHKQSSVFTSLSCCEWCQMNDSLKCIGSVMAIGAESGIGKQDIAFSRLYSAIDTQQHNVKNTYSPDVSLN